MERYDYRESVRQTMLEVMAAQDGIRAYSKLAQNGHWCALDARLQELFEGAPSVMHSGDDVTADVLYFRVGTNLEELQHAAKVYGAEPPTDVSEADGLIRRVVMRETIRGYIDRHCSEQNGGERHGN